MTWNSPCEKNLPLQDGSRSSRWIKIVKMDQDRHPLTGIKLKGACASCVNAPAIVGFCSRRAVIGNESTSSNQSGSMKHAKFAIDAMVIRRATKSPAWPGFLILVPKGGLEPPRF
ncbi:MAG: hypothetical protein WKF61_05625 [Luteimonas sp.]